MRTAKKTTSKAKLITSNGMQTVIKFFTPTADKQIQRRPIRTLKEVKNGEINAAKSTNGKRKHGL